MAPTVAHAHLAPVELDDEDASRTSRRVRRSAVRLAASARGWVAAASVAVLLALLGVQSMLDARERARLEYLADVPGVLSPLHDPPGALRPWAPSAGALVAEDSAGRWTIGARYHRGGVDLRGTDPDTGDVLWSVPFSLAAAVPARGRQEFPSVWVRCTTTTSAAGPRAVCAAEVSPAPADGGVTPLLVLDPATGRTLADLSLEPGSLWSVTGSHLVVATTAARRRRRGALGPHRDRPRDGGRAVAPTDPARPRGPRGAPG